MLGFISLLLILGATGCVYDTSNKLLEHLTSDAAVRSQEEIDAAVFVGCTSGALCNECGIEVCVERTAGTYLECRPVADQCSEGQTCNDEAICVDPANVRPPMCTTGETKPCNDCRVQTCLATGSWSECEVTNAACGHDLSCLDVDDGYACVAACSTVGLQDSCEGETVPAFVAVGESWKTADDCSRDLCRRCTCEPSKFKFGQPSVYCDYFCDD